MAGKKEAPSKPGLYLVRKNEERENSELVVIIHGKAPFLRMIAWDLSEGEIIHVEQPSTDWVWSEMIAEYREEGA